MARPLEDPDMKPILLVLACALAFTSTLAFADTLLIERTQVAQNRDLPKRGSSMAQVQALYGAPQLKYPPVGGGGPRTPPITRWQYENFSVYFENSNVVNAVLVKATELEIGPAPVRH